ANEIVVTPGGQGGSVGVYTVHIDISRRLNKKGVSPTIIRAGENKIRNSGLEPLIESAKERQQSLVNDIYARMLASISRNRGVSINTVLNRYGSGDVFSATELVARGMADRIDTLSGTLARLGYALHPAPALSRFRQSISFSASVSANPFAFMKAEVAKYNELM